jgi:chemotaxis protein MotC
MNRWGLHIVAIFAPLVATGAEALEKPEYSNLLSVLYSVQDDIARGDTDAISIQKEIMERLRASLEVSFARSTNDVEWQTVALGFALDGASAQVAAKLMRAFDGSLVGEPLYNAVAAYSSSKLDVAAREFATVDYEAIDSRLAPFVALAHGTADLEIDAPRAARSFERAILLAPGTLIEEVALRRLAVLGIQLGDASILKRVTNLYLRRYSSSPFSGQFFGILAEGAPFLLDEQEAGRLIDLSANLPHRKSIPLLLSLAESHAAAGKVEIVKNLVGKHFQTDVLEAAAWDQRIKFYRLIFGSGEVSASARLANLKAIMAKQLTAKERVLLSISVSNLDEVLKPLELTKLGDDVSRAARLYDVQEPGVIAVGGESLAPISGGENLEVLQQFASVSPNGEADDITKEINLTADKAKFAIQAVDSFLKDTSP